MPYASIPRITASSSVVVKGTHGQGARGGCLDRCDLLYDVAAKVVRRACGRDLERRTTRERRRVRAPHHARDGQAHRRGARGG